MRNAYRGTCYRCGKDVEPRQGHFERVGRGHRKKWPALSPLVTWLTQHAECAIKWRGSDRHFLYAPNAGHGEKVEE